MFKTWTCLVAIVAAVFLTQTTGFAVEGDKKPQRPQPEFPYEFKTMQRGESQEGGKKGWGNTFIMRFNKQTGQAWILTHVGNDLVWVPVPEDTRKETGRK